MNIYPSTKVRPYVYFGYNPITGEFYIGYREANTKPSHIDLFEYRTSSKAVEPIFDQMVWTILAEFDLGNDAYDFEQLSIYENWDNPLLLNETCFYEKKRFKRKKGGSSWSKGKTFSEDHCAKIGAGNKGKVRSNEFKQYFRDLYTGQTVSDETLAKRKDTWNLKMADGWTSPNKGNTAWNKGIKYTKEQKKNMRSSPGKTPWNKGKTTSLKGKTYEEIHGPEKAAELRLRKRKNKN